MSQTLRNLLIAAMLALFGIILTTSYIRAEKRSLARGKEEITVLVAKKDVPPGTPAKNLEEEGYLEKTDILREDQPPQVISDMKSVKELSSNQTIYKGEVLSVNQFETRSSLNPADSIKGTERLVNLMIAPSGTVSELVQPTNQVDVMASGAVKFKINKGLRDTFNVSDDVDEAVCTWVAARGVTVVQTPDSLASQAAGDATAAAAAAAPTAAADDPQLYVVKVSDQTSQMLLWSHAVSDETKLVFNLRPSSGDQETTLTPNCSVPTGF